MMINEKQLTEEVEEYFNEEDTSVGMYAIGKIDSDIVKDFEEVFEVKVTDYDKDYLNFELSNNKYKVELSEHHEQWKMYKIIVL